MAVHVTTQVGVPGKNEREKRHFPKLLNQQSLELGKTNARRYIPHGNCYEDLDTEWTPHNKAMWYRYDDIGPDWKSKLRYIPSPCDYDARPPEIWPDQWYHMRPFPYTYRRTEDEWKFYDNGYENGKVCKWSGVHKASQHCNREISLKDVIGKNRHELCIEKRNYIPYASLGDKPYQAVEYSSGFHHIGSTLPLANFGGPGITKPDTFVPLQTLPPIRSEPYREKEKKRRVQVEVEDVRSLEVWRPATPLVQVKKNEKDKKGQAKEH